MSVMTVEEFYDDVKREGMTNAELVVQFKYNNGSCVFKAGVPVYGSMVFDKELNEVIIAMDEDFIVESARKRCSDCAYLVEANGGILVCSDFCRGILDIPDDECPANPTW